VSDRKYVRWNTEAPFWLDVDEYTALAETDGRREDAVSLYRGELLEGLDEAWIIPLRERLRDQQFSTLLALVDEAQKREDFRKSLEYAQRILRDDPCHEDAVRGLMSSKLALGDRPGAMRAYREFVLRLKSEMDAAPMPATVKLFDSISSATEEPNSIEAFTTGRADAMSTRVGNLPTPLTSLIGREFDIATMCSVLSERRLVTLTGAAGIGKSRLALEIARATEARDGTWLVELAPIGDGSLIASRVLAAVGVPLRPGEPALRTLAAALRNREMLVVLDNCEHLLAEAAAVVDHLLMECPHVRILATTREPLRLRGEFVERVGPLASPPGSDGLTPTLAELREMSATRVFLERASDVNVAIRAGILSEADRRAIQTICARLDGLPLAIELAAARMNVLTPVGLAQHLDDRFGILTGGNRSAEPRHQTLRAMLDWSYEMLKLPERRVFENLSVFAGSWNLRAAEAICADEVLSGLPLLDVISSLTEKSLIFPVGEDGSPRYGMLQTMRAYALERLEREGRLDAVRGQHAEFWIRAGYAAEGSDFIPQIVDVIDALSPDIDNIREALTWSFGERGSAQLAITLVHATRWLLLGVTGTDEAVRWTEAALALIESKRIPEIRGDLQFCFAAARHTNSGNSAELLDSWNHALELYRTLPDQRKASYTLGRMAIFWWLLDDRDQARSCADEALKIAQETGDRLALGYALTARGAVLDADDVEARKAAFAEAIAIQNSLGRPTSIVQLEITLGECEFESGNAEAALRHALKALDVSRAHPSARPTAFHAQMNIPMYLNDLARHKEALSAVQRCVPDVIAASYGLTFIYLLQHGAAAFAGLGDVQRAARVLGFCDARLHEYGAERHINEARSYGELLKNLKANVDESAFLELQRQGSNLSEDQVIAEVMAGSPDLAMPNPNNGVLTVF
jgi:non-specific serine/threonine protein kinase